MILSKNNNFLRTDFDPLDQIRLLKEKCNNISSSLYKVNACYLEEIRRILPQAIRTSIFSLITNQITDDISFSTVKSRKRFQLKIDKLVSNNISLLTIEHLSELAKKIEEENISQINNAKDEMVNAIKSKNNSNTSHINEINSINLTSLPPLENLSIIEGWNGELDTQYSIDYQEDLIKSKQYEIDNPKKNITKENDSIIDSDQSLETFNLKGKDIEILQSIFAIAEESNINDLDSKKEESINEQKTYEVFNNNRLLPQSPIGLHEWMISIDIALIRRLRDLSHAINTELLRSGLVNTLVPVNILDAALAGQLISTKSISNILTLKLPTNTPVGVSGLDIDCLLITPSDLEFDNPRLRKNRANIKHYQNVLLGMIKQQRYWQGRSLAEEVSKQWWKDTTKI